jgi:protein-disulfide isomerase
MGVHGKATDEAMREAVATAAGIDMARLDADLSAHETAIMDLIRRNAGQADALGLKGTPTYLIGPYIVADAPDYDGFAEVVAKFRSQIGH